MTVVYRNEGQLFQDAKFATISDSNEWKEEASDTVRVQLEELLEKREEELVEDLDIPGTKFHWVSPVLRAMGVTFSVAEHTPDEAARPDFTLFSESADFVSAVPFRATRGFFSNVTAVVSCFAWGSDLNALDAAGGENTPALVIDRIIRATGVNWGIVTNGKKWRLYHRETSGLFTTFYEVDLLATLQNPTIDDFKYFWTIFSPEGLGGLKGADPIVKRMLN